MGDNSMAALFSMDPLIYNEFMTSFGGSPFTSSLAQGLEQFSGVSAPQIQIQPQPQQQQQQRSVPQTDMSQFGGGLNVRGNEGVSPPNFDTLAMWSNAPTGFE
jgi:hypothetical protein